MAGLTKNNNSRDRLEAKAAHGTKMLDTSPDKFPTAAIIEKSSLHGTFMGSAHVEDSIELRNSFKRT